MRPALVVLALATVGATAAGLLHDGRAAAADARIEGLRARLVERPGHGGTWSARWRLCWRAVPGAVAYAVTVASSEGVDPEPRRVEAPCWSLTVAAGVQRSADLRRHAALFGPQLSVRVAAVLPGGETGPPTREVDVGLPHG